MLNGVARRASAIRAASAHGSRAFSRMPFRVHRGAIAAPSNPIHENQRVECTWTIRSDAANAPPSPRRRRWEPTATAPATVEKLKVLTPGLTIVRVRPELSEALGDDAVARVRVSSSSADVLRGVHVASRWPNRTLLGFHAPPSHRDLTGHLLTEIDLPHAHGLRHLAAIGLGDVVVQKDVLYAGGTDESDTTSKHWDRSRGRHRRRAGCGRRYDAQSLKLFAANDSRLFVDASSSDMQLSGLKVCAMGANSRVAIECAALDLQRALDVGVVGGGNSGVSISADSLIASRLKLMAMGNGELELAIRRHLEADEIKTFAMGNCFVHLDGPETAGDDTQARARASYQATATIGAACVDTSSLPTQRVKVFTVGSNDLHLHARDALRVRSMGSSVIECVDRLPRQLDVRGLPQPTLIETPASETRAADPTDAERKSSDRQAIKYPTAQDAFEREALLSSARSSFLSRLFGKHGSSSWYGGGSEKMHDSWYGGGSDDDYERWSGSSSHRRRHRRHGRWAEDSWTG